MVEILCHKQPGEVLLMTEILDHLGCMKSYKLWDKLPTSTGDCRISAINSRVLVLQRWRAIPVLLRWLLWWEPGSGTMPQHEFQDPSYIWIMYIWTGYGRYMETTNIWYVYIHISSFPWTGLCRTRYIASATSLLASHQEQHTRVTMRVSLAYSKFKHALSMPCSEIQAIFGMWRDPSMNSKHVGRLGAEAFRSDLWVVAEQHWLVRGFVVIYIDYTFVQNDSYVKSFAFRFIFIIFIMTYILYDFIIYICPFLNIHML